MTDKLTLRQIARKYTKAEIKRLAQQRTGMKSITKSKAAEFGIPWPLPRGWQVVAAGLLPIEQLPAYKASRTAEAAKREAKAKKPKPESPKREPKQKTQPKDPFYSSWAWKKLRYEALAKFEHRCQCCGWQPGDTERGHLVVDHIKPRRHYPELELSLSNVQILCNDCNMGKGHHYADDFRRMDEAFKAMLLH